MNSLLTFFLAATSFIRINQLGYQPHGSKVAVWCSKEQQTISHFQLVEVATGQVVYEGKAGKAYGAYGPFVQTYRLNFSTYKKPGKYMLKAGAASSPAFVISDTVYKGAADFCLRYMRQQRSGYNPFLKDSCHTHDGYTLYGPMPDSTHIDVSGGWHDASDYLQYATTSANATWHLLAAYRDFGGQAILDEAKWGLDWLLKMHPQKDWLFNQIADDRDHQGMRIPKEDSFYGRGYERPVYFCTGKPQGFGKYKSRSTGVASTAGKFASALALGAQLINDTLLKSRALSAYALGLKSPGVCQTAPGRSPYFYEEDNWTDDMELAAATLGKYDEALQYARNEKITPWLGIDTARHYQWYPFINPGHYELARHKNEEVIGYYKQGIERVLIKAKLNAFYRGIPFIWCSNNLTTSFAIQCYWYRKVTGDQTYNELEQANLDWLFGCNPWGSSMVYGLPSWGDTPVDPHSAFTHLKNYPIDGGLVDGPVYGSIYKSLIGITLKDADEYADFQSDLAVYHDDYGDYSTNEPTMDGTASLIYLLASREAEKISVVTRGDTSQPKLALVFTGDEYADGGDYISQVLQQHHEKASFFLTGRFYRKNPSLVKKLVKGGHYLGPHSDAHLLYCDWSKRDSLLVTKEQFITDLQKNLKTMQAPGIRRPKYFLPPYEWYNDSIVAWTNEQNSTLINYTPGTLSHADYTTPAMKNYRSSQVIMQSIQQTKNLNGFILLLHIGAHPDRTDKLYKQLPALIKWLRNSGYQLVTIDQLLK